MMQLTSRAGHASSERRSRRVYLRFTPITEECADDNKAVSSLSTTSLNSANSTTVERVPCPPPCIATAPQRSALSTLTLTHGKTEAETTVGHLSSPKNAREEPKMPRPPTTARSPHSVTRGRWRAVSRPDTSSLTPREHMHLGLLYSNYASNFNKKDCLVNLLRDVTGAESLEECDVWLTQLQQVVGVSRGELYGAEFCAGEEPFEDFRERTNTLKRILTYDELLWFVAWLKTCHKINVIRREPSQGSNESSARSVRRAADCKPAANCARETERLDDVKVTKENVGDTINFRGKRDCGLYRLCTPGGASSQFRMPSISRRLDSASISTTSRGYNLELQSFCELGGGPDGSGTIRLIDLKRMLQSFNIEATFGPCLGKKIDKNNTGCITFNEFLWILEFGVRGKGPAAGIHDNLAAPLPSQSGAIPPFIAERSPRSERRGRVGKSPPLKKSRLALALETIRSFSGCGKLSPYLTKLKPDRHPRGRRRSSPIGRRANKTRSLSPYRRMPSGRPPSCRRAPSRKKFPGRPPTSRGIGERKYL